jgi:hypothetical protein
MNEPVNPAGVIHLFKAPKKALIPKARLASTMNQPDIRVLGRFPCPGTHDLHSSGAASI